MRLRVVSAVGVASVALAMYLASAGVRLAARPDDDDDDGDVQTVWAQVVATGIPGAGAITEVGAFHPGSPIHDKAAFAVSTLPGGILDPTRLLVASTSNFGAPLARTSEAPGTILSIDVNGEAIAVPAGFAAAGGQASAIGGRVRVYTAQSPAFLNSVNNPAAVTGDRPAASLPLGISLNSGFGRPWIANAPLGSHADGTVSVDDPNGTPLAGAPDPVAGGVFVGALTNRTALSTQGVAAGALATALLTKSPDGTNRAVFVALLADGSVVQIHVQKGVDGLAPPGTIAPLDTLTTAAAESADPGVVTRAGIAFNWVPTRNVLLADPLGDRVVSLDLSDDGTLFVAAPREIRSRHLRTPIDIAPAAKEVAAHIFASNTTLAAGADFYVLNRANNSIVRMALDGHVRAVRMVDAAVPGFRVNGIAVSSDARTLWVTATAPGGQGVVLRVPAFGDAAATTSLMSAAIAGGAHDMTAIGTDLFSRDATLEQGLGPLFNGQSCASCHRSPAPGGMGVDADDKVTMIARLKKNEFTFFGPMRSHSVSELGAPCGLSPGMPEYANRASVRNAMTLRGNGLIDAITDRDILANQALEPAAVRGRPNVLADGRNGRFGWKADVATLVEFMGVAYRNEIGITNPIAPVDLVHGCGASRNRPEIDAAPLQAVASFLDTLDPPAPTAATLTSTGATAFAAIGCQSCHTASLPGRGIAVRLYSDLLLHDMGPALADGFQQGSATGSEFRTMPLWRLSERNAFLHDGRATTLVDAISAHGGQAAASRASFLALDAATRQAVLDFLAGI